MGSWKTLAIAVMVSISAQTVAEDRGSYQNSMMMITMAPTLVLVATTGISLAVTKKLKPAKDDALAFIGSDGEIRGAQFEQASRYYQSAYPSPRMSDMQLAQAIVTSF